MQCGRWHLNGYWTGSHWGLRYRRTTVSSKSGSHLDREGKKYKQILSVGNDGWQGTLREWRGLMGSEQEAPQLSGEACSGPESFPWTKCLHLFSFVKTLFSFSLLSYSASQPQRDSCRVFSSLFSHFCPCLGKAVTTQ